MKLLLAGAAALTLLIPVCAAAQSGKKTDVYLIKDGVYTCKSCTPVIKVKADNIYHPVAGNPNFDSVAVNLTGNGLTETDRKAGKVVRTSATSVSVDGRNATTSFTIYKSGKKASGVIVARRVAPAPAGGHPPSGSWQTVASEGAPFSW